MKKLVLTALVLLVGTELFAQAVFTAKASDAKAKVTVDAKKGTYAVDATVAKDGAFTVDLTPDAATLATLKKGKTLTLSGKDLGSGAPDYIINVFTDAKDPIATPAKFSKAGAVVTIDFAKAKIAPDKITKLQVAAGFGKSGGAVKFEVSAIAIK
ncbi:MAG: hypothetical protein LBG05_09900 [Treponema sp.]|jgi:hypothetical protein|nr:hypothetical protein [Treponema sp.]